MVHMADAEACVKAYMTRQDGTGTLAVLCSLFDEKTGPRKPEDNSTALPLETR